MERDKEKDGESVEKESVPEGYVLTEEDHEYVDSCRKIYDTICGKFPPNFGKALSRRERDQKELFMSHFVYSEISFDALAFAIMKIVKKYGKMSDYGSLPTNKCVFYDLGSGTGKAVIAASLVYNFASCQGIEILEGLHQGAEWILQHYHAQADLIKTNGKIPSMGVVEGDFLQRHEWQKADLLFINATCYGDDMLSDIMKISMKMKKGAFVISVSYAIPSKEFDLCEYNEYDMNWGKANVFIQQKITDPHEYVEPVVEEEEEEVVDVLDEESTELAKNALNGLFG